MIKDLLEGYGDKAVRDIQENLSNTGTDATGETSRSLDYRVEENGSTVTLIVTGGRPYFPTVETGSKPSSKNPSPEMIESLEGWTAIRNPKMSAWAVAKTILRDGSKLWQKGGRKDIYTNVREAMIEPLKADLAKESKDAILNGIISR